MTKATTAQRTPLQFPLLFASVPALSVLHLDDMLCSWATLSSVGADQDDHQVEQRPSELQRTPLPLPIAAQRAGVRGDGLESAPLT